MKYPKVIVEGQHKDRITIKHSDLVSVSESGDRMTIDGNEYAIQVLRSQGELSGKCFYLSKSYDYLIGEDDVGHTCLFVLTKGTL